MKIKSPLPFILKPGLTEFSIEFKNGFYVLRSPGFKQNMKKSEYEKIMAHEDVKPKEQQADSLPFPESERTPYRGRKR